MDSCSNECELNPQSRMYRAGGGCALSLYIQLLESQISQQEFEDLVLRYCDGCIVWESVIVPLLKTRQTLLNHKGPVN